MITINSIENSTLKKYNYQFNNYHKITAPPITARTEQSIDKKYFTVKNITIAAATLSAVTAGVAMAIYKLRKNGNSHIINNNMNTLNKNKANDKISTKTKKIKDNVIIGANKFKKILAKLNQADFDSSKTFKANFHIHSIMSDGQLTPLEILEQANAYAKKLPTNEKFSFALTDHDNIDGIKTIIDTITKKPKKYSKLNFIPGIELSVKYHNINLSQTPIELDFLIYAFDSNNQKLIKQIERRRNYLTTKTSDLFDEINFQYPDLDLSVKKMQEESNNGHLKNLCSNGYLKALSEYIQNTFTNNDISESKKLLEEKLLKHFNNTKYAIDSNMELTDAIKLTKELGAFSSMAHPGKFNFNDAGVKGDSVELSDDIISVFIKSGGDGIESHYMSYKTNNQSWWEKIRDSFKKLDLNYYRTGGYDTHTHNIGEH